MVGIYECHDYLSLLPDKIDYGQGSIMYKIDTKSFEKRTPNLTMKINQENLIEPK